MQRFMARSAGATTDVKCPSGCGETVATLGATEAIFTAATQAERSHTISGECPGCGVQYRFPVTRQAGSTDKSRL